MQIFQQRLLMNRYMQARIEQTAVREYERHLRAGIARMEEFGHHDEAQELRKELPQRTEEISDSGVLRAIHAVGLAVKTGKLKL